MPMYTHKSLKPLSREIAEARGRVSQARCCAASFGKGPVLQVASRLKTPKRVREPDSDEEPWGIMLAMLSALIMTLKPKLSHCVSTRNLNPKPLNPKP